MYLLNNDAFSGGLNFAFDLAKQIFAVYRFVMKVRVHEIDHLFKLKLCKFPCVTTLQTVLKVAVKLILFFAINGKNCWNAKRSLGLSFTVCTIVVVIKFFLHNLISETFYSFAIIKNTTDHDQHLNQVPSG